MAVTQLTADEYARIMRVSPQHVRDMCRQGRIKAFALCVQGRQQWRIPFDTGQLEAMAEHNRRATAV